MIARRRESWLGVARLARAAHKVGDYVRIQNTVTPLSPKTLTGTRGTLLLPLNADDTIDYRAGQNGSVPSARRIAEIDGRTGHDSSIRTLGCTNRP